MDLLKRISHNILTASAQGRHVYEVGPFRAFIHPDDDLRFYNWAAPMVDCENWSPWIDGLIDLFVTHQRLPRLEYLTAQFPSLRPALERAGFQAEVVAPVMTLTPKELIPPPSADVCISLLTPESPSSDFRDMYRVGMEGFGLEVKMDREEEVDGRGEAPGARLRALARVDGEAAGCGVLMCTGDVAEMAGVATLPAYRRRGIAAHLCHFLLEIGFGQGLELVWLSAADERAVALYHTLGFRPSGEQLHISRGLAPWEHP